MVSLNSVVTATNEQVSSEVSGEAAILHLKSGRYYGLNEVGNRIWQLIQTPQPVSVICESVVAEYEVEPAQCEQDVLKILQELQAEGLVHVRNETTA